MRILFLTLLIGFIFTSDLRAETRITTDRLYQLCSIDETGAERVQDGHVSCQSYIIGVLDYYQTLKALDAVTGVNFCLPDNVSDFDLQTIVLRYIGENARHKGFLAAPVVVLALQAQFPCVRSISKTALE